MPPKLGRVRLVMSAAAFAERGVHLARGTQHRGRGPEGRRGHECDLSRGKQVRFLQYCERIG